MRVNINASHPIELRKAAATVTTTDPLEQALAETGLTLAAVCQTDPTAPLSPEARQELANLLYEIARQFQDENNGQ